MNESLNSTEHWAIARLAYWYLDRGRWREAETLARGLLALDQRDAVAWNYYGEARLQQDDIAEAARGFGEAAKLYEDRADIWMRLGDVLIRLGRYDEARRALEKARTRTMDDRLVRRIDALTAQCR